MIVLDLSILNQKGTPMFYSDVLSAIPNFGIVGRIFIQTDSPYGIFRDTGTSWVQIASVGTSGAITGSGTATQVAYFTSSSAIGSSSNLFWDNTNGRIGINTATPGASVDAHGTSGTIIQANATALGNSQMAFQLQGTSKWQIGNVYQSGANYFRINDSLSSVERIKVQNTGEFDVQGWEVLINTQASLSGITTIPYNNSFTNNFTYNSGISTISSFNSIGFLVDNNLNWSGANTINSTSYNACLVLRTNMTFGTAGASITYTQSAGIRALSNKQSIYIQSGANSGTISHYANLQIFGDQKLGAGTTTFTNRYQVLLNDYDEFSAGNTYTNRWAIYQSGSLNTNYFNGKIITGSSTTISTYQLDVTGTTRLTGDTLLTGTLTPSIISFPFANFSNKLYIYNGGATTDNSGIGYTTSGGIAIFVGLTGTMLFGARLDATNMTTLNAAMYISTLNTLFINSCKSAIFSWGGASENFISFYNGGATTSRTGYGIQGGGVNAIYAASTGDIKLGVGFDTSTITTANSAIYIPNTNNVVINNNLLIGTSTLIASSILTLNSTTKGFLPPRMTTTQKNAIGTPAQGLVIFDTTLVKLCVYSGTTWETITSV
jgi:hypothetical protein